jgi:alpha-tubulin suppressor-like RCC1 family protein
VATVDSAGRVRGVAPGLAVITASIDVASDSAAVTVLPAVETIGVSPDVWSMVRGGSIQLTATLRDGEGGLLDIEARPVRWESSKPGLVEVDTTGLATGVGAGTATVSAMREGRSAAVDVTVEVVSFASLHGGSGHTCGLTPGGKLYCWGRPPGLGDGTTQERRTPTPVATDLSFVFVSAGKNLNCAIDSQQDGYCWGRNYYGELGNGTTEASEVPVLVMGGHKFVYMDAGQYHACGITVLGETYCWGRNASGQLGTGAGRDDSTVPVLVAGGHDFETVSAGYAVTCAITRGDGSAYCWGRNGHGQLGTGTANPGSSETPLAVTGPGRFRAISVSYHQYVCGLALTDDHIYCWGHNDFGMLGRGWRSRNENDVAPIASSMTFVDVGVSDWEGCGLGTDANVYCWGSRSYLMSESFDYPVQTTAGLDFVSLAVGSQRFCGLASDGRAYCQGYMPGDDTSRTTTVVRVAGQI